MKLFLLALVAALVMAPAVALEKTFSWTAPTQNTDGSALPAVQITGYTLTCGTLVVPITGPVTTFKRDFGAGAYTCSLQTRANGQTSSPSNAVSFTVPQPTPNAPAGFSVD